MNRLPAQYHSWLRPRRLALLAAALTLAIVAFWLLRSYSAWLNPALVRELAVSLGPLGPLALIGALAILLVAPLAPAVVLQIGAGLAFGPLLGLVYALIADALGASIGFWIARRWGRSLIEPRLSPTTREQVERMAQRVTWRSLMVLRLLPGPAYPLVSFAAGYSRLRFRTYTLASLAGVLPSLALLAFAGDLVTSSPVLAFGLVALFVGGLALIGRWWGRQVEE